MVIYYCKIEVILMSILMQIPLSMEWLRMANKYIENLYRIDTSKYGYVTVRRDVKDDKFIDEFDYIVKNMGL